MFPRRVAVIGAGPSGLTVLREMARNPELFAPTAFEQRTTVGGIWNHSEPTGTDKFGLPYPNSIYSHLITNLPKQLMAYDDFPFPAAVPSFMPHPHVKRYYDDFADKYDLRKFVKFETLVTKVKPQKLDARNRLSWLVDYCDVTTEQKHSSIFDAVVVCVGMFQYPFVPELPGAETFEGVTIHTKDYRDPDLYKDKDVLILGSSFSAGEIVKDLAPRARKLYGQYRSTSLINMSTVPEVNVIGPIREVQKDGLLLEDGQQIKIDVIFYATGYRLCYPFLAPECQLSVKDDRVTPLYRHVVHVKYPSLSIISLVKRTPVTHTWVMQARYACAVISGKLELPTEAEMLRHEEEDYRERIVSRGLPDRATHDFFGFEPFKTYMEQLTKEGNLEQLHPDVIKFTGFLYEVLKQGGFEHLRRYEFQKNQDGEYVIEKVSDTSPVYVHTESPTEGKKDS